MTGSQLLPTNNEKGFTFMKLLAAKAIMGILAPILFPTQAYAQAATAACDFE